jgi:hypothetical protein
MLQNLKTFFIFLKPFGVGFTRGPGTLNGSFSSGSTTGTVSGLGTVVGLGRTAGWGDFK